MSLCIGYGARRANGSLDNAVGKTSKRSEPELADPRHRRLRRTHREDGPKQQFEVSGEAVCQVRGLSIDRVGFAFMNTSDPTKRDPRVSPGSRFAARKVPAHPPFGSLRRSGREEERNLLRLTQLTPSIQRIGPRPQSRRPGRRTSRRSEQRTKDRSQHSAGMFPNHLGGL
jgi:hypothetical protein